MVFDCRVFCRTLPSLDMGEKKQMSMSALADDPRHLSRYDRKLGRLAYVLP